MNDINRSEVTNVWGGKGEPTESSMIGLDLIARAVNLKGLQVPFRGRIFRVICQQVTNSAVSHFCLSYLSVSNLLR